MNDSDVRSNVMLQLIDLSFFLSFVFVVVVVRIEKDLVNRYPVDNDDDGDIAKRSHCYHEENLSNIIHTTSDVKYASF
jgi:hypothetical protein